MKRAAIWIAAVTLGASVAAWGGGASESGASSTRGQYLAGQGLILPPAEVYVDSLVASIDYAYPNPQETFGVTLVSGNRQLARAGQEEVIHIGVQARRSPFSELPPLNLAFVIDHSGSMAGQDKLTWVKEAFDVFLHSVRDTDFVSLVIFDNTAEVLVPSTRMNGADRRERFRAAVESILPAGGTNLVAGMQAGYQQVMANYRAEYTNRVLFLTDGVGESRGLLDMAEQFREMGINVSTIGVGRDFDVDLMMEVARTGGGSSRFISDREEMEEIFGSELDRMVVSAARNLRITLTFPFDVQVLGTWGYENRVEGRAVHYALPTLHHGDYETILAQIRVPPQDRAGMTELARLTIAYDDLEGVARSAGPYVLEAEFVDREYPVAGFSSGYVLRSGTMLRFAGDLKAIGDLYFERGTALRTTSVERLKQALDRTGAARRELVNAKLRLDNIGFDDEIAILDNYLNTLGRELATLGVTDIAAARGDEIAPPVAARPLQDHIEGLFREMTLSLPAGNPGVIAVSGFSARDGRETGLSTYLNEMAVTELSRYPGLRLVERARLDRVMEEQELSLSDLIDTTTAVKIGHLVAANRIITGSIVEMGASVVIFGRIINLETGEVESAAQVIVPKDGEVRSLLT